MTLTTHGHHIPYTPLNDEPLKTSVTTCSNAESCKQCVQEAHEKMSVIIYINYLNKIKGLNDPHKSRSSYSVH